jgi:hypothetical protein
VLKLPYRQHRRQHHDVRDHHQRASPAPATAMTTPPRNTPCASSCRTSGTGSQVSLRR